MRTLWRQAILLAGLLPSISPAADSGAVENVHERHAEPSSFRGLLAHPAANMALSDGRLLRAHTPSTPDATPFSSHEAGAVPLIESSEDTDLDGVADAIDIDDDADLLLDLHDPNPLVGLPPHDPSNEKHPFILTAGSYDPSGRFINRLVQRGQRLKIKGGRLGDESHTLYVVLTDSPGNVPAQRANIENLLARRTDGDLDVTIPADTEAIGDIELYVTDGHSRSNRIRLRIVATERPFISSVDARVTDAGELRLSISGTGFTPESSVFINGTLLPSPSVDGGTNIQARAADAPRLGVLQIVNQGEAGNKHAYHAVSQRAITVRLPKDASGNVALLEALSGNARIAPVDRHGNAIVESLSDCVYVVVGPRSNDQITTLTALIPMQGAGKGTVDVTSTLTALTLLPHVTLGQLSLSEACEVQESIAAILRGSPLETKIRADLANGGGISMTDDAAFTHAFRHASIAVSEWLSARRPPQEEAPARQR